MTQPEFWYHLEDSIGSGSQTPYRGAHKNCSAFAGRRRRCQYMRTCSVGPITQGNNDLMTILLDAGADPNENDRWKIPLVEAISKGRLSCAKLLIEYGADLEGIDSKLISDFSFLGYDKHDFGLLLRQRSN